MTLLVFSVGIVDRKNVIDGSTVKEGDVILGIASSGVHSNGFSLVRKIFGLDTEAAKENLQKDYGVLSQSLGETLLAPTKIYVKAIETLKQSIRIKAISHITGGGFYENIPRMLPAYTNARIEKGSWEIRLFSRSCSKRAVLKNTVCLTPLIWELA